VEEIKLLVRRRRDNGVCVYLFFRIWLTCQLLTIFLFSPCKPSYLTGGLESVRSFIVTPQSAKTDSSVGKDESGLEDHVPQSQSPAKHINWPSFRLTKCGTFSLGPFFNHLHPRSRRLVFYN
jgi:hypothetical protein